MPPAQIANASSVFNPLQDAVEIISVSLKSDEIEEKLIILFIAL